MHGTANTSHVIIGTGERLTIRVARPSDAAEVREFLEGLSAESRRLRYHSPVPVVRWWMVSSVTDVDHDRRESLLALLDGRVVGVAEWGLEPARDGRAHVAVVVDDQVRRRGIAQALISRLGRTARRHGIEEFVATVVTTNRPVLHLIEKMSPERSSRFDGGAVEVVIPLAV